MSEDIPVDSLVGTLNTALRPSMPYVPSDYEEPEENYAITRLTPDLTAEPVDLHLKTDATGRISALWYEYVEDEGTTGQPDNGDKEEEIGRATCRERGDSSKEGGGEVRG